MTKMSEQAYWAAVRADPKVFLRHAFGTVYPGKAFMDNGISMPLSTASSWGLRARCRG